MISDIDKFYALSDLLVFGVSSGFILGLTGWFLSYCFTQAIHLFKKSAG